VEYPNTLHRRRPDRCPPPIRAQPAASFRDRVQRRGPSSASTDIEIQPGASICNIRNSLRAINNVQFASSSFSFSNAYCFHSIITSTHHSTAPQIFVFSFNRATSACTFFLLAQPADVACRKGRSTAEQQQHRTQRESDRDTAGEA